MKMLHDNNLLDITQYGFVLDGDCIKPLNTVNALYEDALAHGKTLHLAFLDATSAFDSAPHTALDAALRPRLWYWYDRSCVRQLQRKVKLAIGFEIVSAIMGD